MALGAFCPLRFAPEVQVSCMLSSNLKLHLSLTQFNAVGQSGSATFPSHLPSLQSLPGAPVVSEKAWPVLEPAPLSGS